MTVYLRLEIRRMLTDARFVLLMLVLPVAMYLLFTNLFDGSDSAGYTAAMVNMAAFGAIGAALMATGPRIAQERTSGWTRQLRAMPMPAWRVITVRMTSALVMALPAIVLVDITAVLNHGVTLTAGQWIATGALIWVGTLPFTALGSAIGYFTDADTAFGVMYGVCLFLSAAGGLWMPTKVLPQVLQDIAPVLPSNRLAELGWKITTSQDLSVAGIAILLGWLVLFTALAALGHRRDLR